MSERERYQNAIWIFGDQQPAHALSCNGNPNLNTPRIDRLAAEGQSYVRAVSGYPICCPYRGSLMTSRYPHECVPGHEHRMPPEMPTIAHAFREHGFHTAYFGKWHVDGFHEREGRAAMHIIPPERRWGSRRGSAMRTITASGTAGCMMGRAKTHSTTACRDTRRMPSPTC